MHLGEKWNEKKRGCGKSYRLDVGLWGNGQKIEKKLLKKQKTGGGGDRGVPSNWGKDEKGREIVRTKGTALDRKCITAKTPEPGRRIPS